MADNDTIKDGTGASITVANDDIGGVKYPRFKMTWGPDGTANDADAATGKPLPIQLRSATGLIPIGEPTDAKSTATDTTSVTGISIWKQISASVQLMVFGAGLATTAQRTTLASDDPAVATLGATTGSAVITDANGTIQQYLRGIVKLLITAGTVVLGAGTAIIGKVGIDQTTPGTTNLVAAGQNGTWTVQPGNTANTTAWKVDGSAVTQPVSSGASATGGYSYLNIAAGQATTVVKASAGTLHSIILNSAATAANTTVIYDHASGVGTVIGRPAVTTATVPTTLLYDIAFATGLTIITATQNGGDMTVCYK